LHSDSLLFGARQEPAQHATGKNLGKYGCRALSQPAHVFETDFPPAYAPLAPYKFIAAERDLVPVSSRTIMPDLRWLVAGGFAIVSCWLSGYAPPCPVDFLTRQLVCGRSRPESVCVSEGTLGSLPRTRRARCIRSSAPASFGAALQVVFLCLLPDCACW